MRSQLRKVALTMNLNKAMIIGNLTRDPETRTTPSGQTVANFSVATNLVWTDATGQKQKKVEFHNVVAWRKLAEICAQYLKKGGKVYVEGRLQTRDWQGQDGVKRYRTEIIADNMIMLDHGNANANEPAASASSEPSEPALPTEITNETATEEIKVEEVPF